MYFSSTYSAGRVAEWFKAPVLKLSSRRLSLPQAVLNFRILLNKSEQRDSCYRTLPHPALESWVAIPVARPVESHGYDSPPA
jgi:hypothetical protein